ncbi:conserved hypothetical protein [Leishmania mexicana MHOM/GT/2001/U1103]|uniref:Uncharacterized protein n=1 Tax=Leishmania mexicana (strain MHOM/GT/2001/U1103) TaxID=929439 RepID=E9AWR1_LEIMU|nr:conserved hypothetical protein [Leishmania mexicana MHOM/GT/2001/U1103]CBZ27397.1 conserved hypothetical protein [Leishmania mexicana MHOM/GT/2001/U1103]
MTPIKAPRLSSLPLATAWWRQHGLADRLDSFRACRQPTPRQQPLQRTTDGGVSLGWAGLSTGTKQSLTSSPTTATDRPPDLPLVLVSACLLSYPITYRGTHTSLPALLRPTPLLFLTEVLFKELALVQCVPVCPEVQWLGLPVPRVPLRLVRGSRGTGDARQRGNGWAAAQHSSSAISPSLSMGASDSVAIKDEREVRYLVESSAEDHVLLRYDAPNDTFADQSPSPQLHSAFLAQLLQDLKAVDGIILKSYSPSCGVRDARLYEEAVTPPPSSLCDQHVCNACEHTGKPTSASFTGRRPAASTSAQRRFDLVDGFFTQQLRNFLASMHGVDGGRCADARCHPEAAVPVITCDRLLTDFYTEERLRRVPLAWKVKKRRVAGNASEAAPHLTSLDSFMESVLQHRDWRVSQGRC